MDGGEVMAVIGIGTTSRVTVEDIMGVIAAAIEKAGSALNKVPPHPNPLPEGRGGAPLFLAHMETVDSGVLSPLGERDRVRGSSLLGWGEGGLFQLATLDRPAINPALEAAASEADLRLKFLTLDELHATASRCITHSEKSMKQYGVPSVAEAAALAAAGTGARLLVPRFCGRNTTASVAIVP